MCIRIANWVIYIGVVNRYLMLLFYRIFYARLLCCQMYFVYCGLIISTFINFVHYLCTYRFNWQMPPSLFYFRLRHCCSPSQIIVHFSFIHSKSNSSKLTKFVEKCVSIYYSKLAPLNSKKHVLMIYLSELVHANIFFSKILVKLREVWLKINQIESYFRTDHSRDKQTNSIACCRVSG